MDAETLSAVQRYEDRIDALLKERDAAVAAERERCAKILADYADCSAYDPEEHDDLMAVVAKIRSGE